MWNSMLIFPLSVYGQKYPFWPHLILKVKIVGLSWRLVPRLILIRICRTRWWCSLFMFFFFLLFIFYLFIFFFCANLILKIKVVSLSSNLAPRITWTCRIRWRYSVFSSFETGNSFFAYVKLNGDVYFFQLFANFVE